MRSRAARAGRGLVRRWQQPAPEAEQACTVVHWWLVRTMLALLGLCGLPCKHAGTRAAAGWSFLAVNFAAKSGGGGGQLSQQRASASLWAGERSALPEQAEQACAELAQPITKQAPKKLPCSEGHSVVACSGSLAGPGLGEECAAAARGSVACFRLTWHRVVCHGQPAHNSQEHCKAGSTRLGAQLVGRLRQSSKQPAPCGQSTEALSKRWKNDKEWLCWQLDSLGLHGESIKALEK